MRVSITLSFATCILCFLKRESESDDFTNGSLLADISQYMSSQRSIERDNRTLSKRVNSMASPYGSFPMQSVSSGPIWREGIDRGAFMFTTQILHECNRVKDAAGFIATEAQLAFGPIQVSQTREVWHIIKVAENVFYNDLVNVLLWAVSPNYRNLDASGNAPNVWAHFDPHQAPGITTPWLRTDAWLWNGWTQSSFEQGPDIEILIFTVPRASSTGQVLYTLNSYGLIERIGMGPGVLSILTRSFMCDEGRLFRPALPNFSQQFAQSKLHGNPAPFAAANLEQNPGRAAELGVGALAQEVCASVLGSNEIFDCAMTLSEMRKRAGQA